MDKDQEHVEDRRGGASPAESATGEREANPAESPGPRGNQDVDPERVERDREDYERTGAN